MKLGIKMTKTNRLKILRRARQLIEDKKYWTHGKLRRRVGTRYTYCLLGACEQAMYDVGLAEPGPKAFTEQPTSTGEGAIGYRVGRELSLQTFAMEKYRRSPDAINDLSGHEGALSLLDEYIAEVEQTPANKLRPWTEKDYEEEGW